MEIGWLHDSLIRYLAESLGLGEMTCHTYVIHLGGVSLNTRRNDLMVLCLKTDGKITNHILMRMNQVCNEAYMNLS